MVSGCALRRYRARVIPEHLVNTQCLYPSRNISSTAVAMAEATDGSNEHDHRGSAQRNEHRHVS